MPKIRSISIENFRSIKRLEVDTHDLAIFVGDNDSGKSNILRALNLFFNGETNPGQRLDFSHDFNKFVKGNKRAKEISIELVLELPGSYRKTNGERVRWKKVWRESGLTNPRDYVGLRQHTSKRGNVSYEDVEISPKSNLHSLLTRVEFEYVPAIRSAEFFRQLRGRIYGVIAQVAEEGFRERSSDFESAIADNVAPLIEDVLKDLSDNTRLSLPNDLSSIFERLDFLSGDASISLDSRGDGIKGRYIPLILKFIADKKQLLQVRGAQPYTFIWAYEEPENNLEFRRAQELASRFKELTASHLAQILLTTHSPVFFNMNEEDEKSCSVCYVTRLSEGNTEAESQVGTPGILDEKMGVMPIIAKHVRSAQKEIYSIRQQKEQIERLLKDQNKPTLFVEGTTDFTVVSHLVRRFIPDLEEKLNIEEPPPSGGGASYVADRLIAWILVQKNRPVDQRSLAVGLVDYDKAGNTAAARFNEFNVGGSLAKIVKLPKPAHVIDASKNGFVLPVTLEELYVPEWWAYADGRGWLTDRKKIDILSESSTEQFLSGKRNFSDEINGKYWSLFAEKMTRPDAKVSWANWIVAKGDEELNAGLKPLIDVLKKIRDDILL